MFYIQYDHSINRLYKILVGVPSRNSFFYNTYTYLYYYYYFIVNNFFFFLWVRNTKQFDLYALLNSYLFCTGSATYYCVDRNASFPWEMVPRHDTSAATCPSFRQSVLLARQKNKNKACYAKLLSPRRHAYKFKIVCKVSPFIKKKNCWKLRMAGLILQAILILDQNPRTWLWDGLRLVVRPRPCPNQLVF